MDAKLYQPSLYGRGYLAFLGRISPEKRPDRAIAVATRLGRTLRIAAKVDRADQVYFEEKIEPLLHNPLVEYIGEIGDERKSQFLGGADALLFPIDWPEPFGLVMIEAMACGTPVIAYPLGSVPEIIRDGINGYIVPDLDSAVQAVKKVNELDRKKVRKYFEQHFTADRMAKEYVAVYERLASRKKLPASSGVLNWMKVTSPSNTT
jgi:glycosyltransferase involved in cell wall biosynthesis